jgi:NADH:ubiquinone oxidoreductase subunit H
MSNFKYVEIFFISLLLLIPIILIIPFFVLGERKVLASIQKRKGPDSVGF